MGGVAGCECECDDKYYTKEFHYICAVQLISPCSPTEPPYHFDREQIGIVEFIFSSQVFTKETHWEEYII